MDRLQLLSFVVSATRRAAVYGPLFADTWLGVASLGYLRKILEKKGGGEALGFSDALAFLGGYGYTTVRDMLVIEKRRYYLAVPLICYTLERRGRKTRRCGGYEDLLRASGLDFTPLDVLVLLDKMVKLTRRAAVFGRPYNKGYLIVASNKYRIVKHVLETDTADSGGGALRVAEKGGRRYVMWRPSELDMILRPHGYEMVLRHIIIRKDRVASAIRTMCWVLDAAGYETVWCGP